MSDKEWFQIYGPQMQSLTFHCTPGVPGSSDPWILGLVTHLCQWRSRQSSSGFGGIRTSPSRSTSGHWRLSARRPSTSSEWSHTWSGAETDTLLMMYRAIVRSKLDYGCIVYGTASNTDLRQLDSIHNAGVRLALGAFCTSPVSSMYTEANEAPLAERQLKLSMHYYLKTRACTDNQAHHALHEFDPTIRDLYLPRPNGRGGMTRPSNQPVGLKLEEAMTSAEIDVELVCPLKTPCFPPGTHGVWSKETQPHWGSE